MERKTGVVDDVMHDLMEAANLASAEEEWRVAAMFVLRGICRASAAALRSAADFVEALGVTGATLAADVLHQRVERKRSARAAGAPAQA